MRIISIDHDCMLSGGKCAILYPVVKPESLVLNCVLATSDNDKWLMRGEWSEFYTHSFGQAFAFVNL